MPAPLSRHNPYAHKNDFGHVLVLAGSARMLGAAALACNAAMRSGAGLVTLGVPKSLNTAAQKKIAPIVMTLPLPGTNEQSLSLKAYAAIKRNITHYDALAIGPGLSQNPSTQKLIRKVVATLDIPMIIDADALNALAKDPGILRKTKSLKILTPHAGEMSRLTGHSVALIENHRQAIAKAFAQKYGCVIVLKGHRTIVASAQGKVCVNKTGNVGMATAGSGDVLTGVLAAFLGQRIKSFDAARLAVFFHGKAGDLAASQKGKVSLVATDILDNLPLAFRK